MSCQFPGEDVEALVRDELSNGRAARVAAHIAECESCRDEEDWLRLELAAFETRRDGASGAADLWAGVEERLGEQADASGSPRAKAGGLLWFSGGFAAAAAVAAALFMFVAPTSGPPRVVVVTKVVERDRPAMPVAVTTRSVEAKAHADLDKAEQQYIAALNRLRAAYQRRYRVEPALVRVYEQSMDDNLHRLRAARRVAGDDVEGRVRVLDAYSSYVETLQSAAEGMDI